jgi:Kef-type K+ transport system membrane component KefB
MIEDGIHFVTIIFLTGVLIVVAMWIKSGMGRISLPPLIGYLMLGLLLRVLDTSWGIFFDGSREILQFLGKIGLITLLFRVGLESNLKGLLHQLRHASLIWMADITVSGTVGFLTAFYLLDLGWITSLIVATAFTATSVGISVTVWQDMKALQSSNGELLIDVAELDDISAVVLMAMLFAILPSLKDSPQAATPIIAVFFDKTWIFLMKLIGYGGFCFLFSRYAEKSLTSYLQKLEPMPDPMLTVTGIGFMIAAIAGWLGFSLAIGAFFAGVVFSRDPQAVKMEASFLPLHDLFSPFFFIAIGLHLDPGTLGDALGVGFALTVAAVVAKIVADGLPVLFMRGSAAATLIGVSMVPRAEITMVIMQKGQQFGEWAVPSRVYGAMIIVSAATCILAPVTVKSLLRRWPQKN